MLIHRQEPVRKESMIPLAKPHPSNKVDATLKPEAFAELGLGPCTLAAVRRIGFTETTEIQDKFIPAALTERDCVGKARTGTGKTAAYLLPIYERFYGSEETRALILAPTRELASQITNECRKLSGNRSPHAIAVYGGTSINQQIERLRKDPEIIVATPGRVLDLSRRGAISFNRFTLVVLDEVDRMFDMGFINDIQTIIRGCTNRRQTMFLSATLPKDIMRLAERYLCNPIRVSAVDDDAPSVETLDQRYFSVREENKLQLLLKVLGRENPELALIFTRTKIRAERLGEELQRRKYNARHIHGGLPQNKRNRTISNFRERTIQLLVATDLMGRGIDVPGISHVINYDIPDNPGDYLHRIGRSGRMNAPGKAFTFVTPRQGKEITAIEMLCNRLLDADEIPGFNDHTSHPDTEPRGQNTYSTATLVIPSFYGKWTPSKSKGTRRRR